MKTMCKLKFGSLKRPKIAGLKQLLLQWVGFLIKIQYIFID